MYIYIIMHSTVSFFYFIVHFISFLYFLVHFIS
ncbi:hypothetical protein PFUGPA_00969, partial [Plasmodium falciparum Palo Alto/Uganda]